MYLSSLKILNKKEVQNHDKYPFCVPSLKGTDSIEFKNAVTFFVGENGCHMFVHKQSDVVAEHLKNIANKHVQNVKQ